MNNTDFQTTFAKIFGLSKAIKDRGASTKLARIPITSFSGSAAFGNTNAGGLSQIDETDMAQFQNAFIYHFMRSPRGSRSRAAKGD